MTDDGSGGAEQQSLVRALLGPLRAPQRAAANIETIASAVVSLQRDAHKRLASVDERAGALLRAVKGLSGRLDELDRKVALLQELEQAMTEQTDAIRDDLNTHMLTLEEEIRTMRSPIEQMSSDIATIMALLPNPSDGPLRRLRDTLTPS
jgi:chromosome segregation ATPase